MRITPIVLEAATVMVPLARISMNEGAQARPGARGGGPRLCGRHDAAARRGAAVVSTRESVDRLAEVLGRIAQGPAGAPCRQGLMRTDASGTRGNACAALEEWRRELRAAEPYCCCCPGCHATHPECPDPVCKTCGGQGWTTRAAFDACPESDRQHLLKSRPVRQNGM